MTILRILFAVVLVLAIALCGYTCFLLLHNLFGQLRPLFSCLL
ncbi:MAG: hypothetical protein ACOX83_07960 [Candidatus Spyradocola sp.]|jgi:hypothetical protein